MAYTISDNRRARRTRAACPVDGSYQITWGREFRYDGARAGSRASRLRFEFGPIRPYYGASSTPCCGTGWAAEAVRAA